MPAIFVVGLVWLKLVGMDTTIERLHALVVGAKECAGIPESQPLEALVQFTARRLFIGCSSSAGTYKRRVARAN